MARRVPTRSCRNRGERESPAGRAPTVSPAAFGGPGGRGSRAVTEKRRPGVSLERNQHRKGGPGKPVIVKVEVGDGIEDPGREKYQVASLRIETRGPIIEVGAADLMGFAGSNIVQEEIGGGAAGGRGEGEPVPIGRPCGARDPRKRAAVDSCDRASPDVDQQNLVPMIGDRHQPLAPRGRVDGAHPSQVAFDELHRPAPGHFASVGPAQGERLLTGLVGHRDDALSVAQPGGQALAGRGHRSMSSRPAFPQGHRVSAAAGGDRHRMTLGVQGDPFDEPAWRMKPALALGTR